MAPESSSAGVPLRPGHAQQSSSISLDFPSPTAQLAPLRRPPEPGPLHRGVPLTSGLSPPRTPFSLLPLPLLLARPPPSPPPPPPPPRASLLPCCVWPPALPLRSLSLSLFHSLPAPPSSALNPGADLRRRRSTSSSLPPIFPPAAARLVPDHRPRFLAPDPAATSLLRPWLSVHVA